MSRRPLAVSLSEAEPTRLTSMPIPIGRGMVLAGKYRVDRVLGEGGMGVVVAAEHLQLAQKVALKFLLPAVAKDPETVQRFLREAQAASRIRSEHVARVIDVGTLDMGAPYMVMELLEGRDLAGVLLDRGALPPQEAVDLVLQGMEAIAEAHALGIVHRDIKPANLFLTRRADGSPLVKVLDFGLSKEVTLQKGQRALTKTSTSGMGSPLYMAPEQVRSAKSTSFPADVWSLGVVLYELLTNQTPFDGEGIGALLASVVADEPRPLRAAAPHLPAALEAAVMRCLVKAPSGRHADLGALARALAPFASPAGRGSVDRIVGALAHGIEPRTDPDLQAVGPTGSAKVRSLWNVSSSPDAAGAARKNAFVFVGLVAVGAAVGIGSFVALRSGQPAAPAQGGVDTSDRPLVTATPLAPPGRAPDPVATDTADEPALAVSASAEAASSAAPDAAAPSATSSAAPPRRPPRQRPRPKKPTRPTIDDVLKQGRH